MYPQSGYTAQINIARFVLMETGTYNAQYQRPYETVLDGSSMNAICRRIEESKATRVTGSLLAGLSLNMVRPEANPGNIIQINHGWNERRIRFMMEVHSVSSLGLNRIHYIQGYTAYSGITMAGAIDPNMDFIINSIITVSRTQQLTPSGYIPIDRVVDNVQVMSDNSFVSMMQPSGVIPMRPMDVMVGIHANLMQNGFSVIGDPGVVDTRLLPKREAIQSERRNNVPGQYAARILDVWGQASLLSEFGQGTDSIATQAIHDSGEPNLYENAFIRAISDIRGVATVNNFRIDDLRRIDPNVERVTNFSVTGGISMVAGQPQHEAGQTANWNATDMETVVASMLSNSIPGLMMDVMISKCIFKSTNETIDGRPASGLIDGKSMMNIDMRPQFDNFVYRFENEIVPDFTYGGQLRYRLTMHVDLFGETWISISLNGNPNIDYVTPSFCDTLMSPVIAPTYDKYNRTVSDFESFINYVGDAMNKPAINTNSLL